MANIAISDLSSTSLNNLHGKDSDLHLNGVQRSQLLENQAEMTALKDEEASAVYGGGTLLSIPPGGYGPDIIRRIGNFLYG